MRQMTPKKARMMMVVGMLSMCTGIILFSLVHPASPQGRTGSMEFPVFSLEFRSLSISAPSCFRSVSAIAPARAFDGLAECGLGRRAVNLPPSEAAFYV
jgi:hypothetical protein